MKKQIKKNKKGFTLVEMIVVIAIIGVLAAMMVPSLLGYIDKANTSNNRAAAASIGRAAQAVLVEINSSTENGTYTAEPATSPSTKGISITKTTGGTDKFKDSLEKMYENEKFNGYFIVVTENGSLKSVHYKKTGTPTSVPSGDTSLKASTKEVGVYPES